MDLKNYLALLVFGTLLCWCAWVLVLMNIDPTNSGFIGLASFFLSLFFGLLGTLTLLGFAFRRAFQRERVAFDHIGVSLRQGLFFALVFVGALLLRSVGLYTWWNILFLVAGFTVLEFFFLTRDAA